MAPQAQCELAEKVKPSEVELPYVVKDVILFSPGKHNNAVYTEEAIKRAFYNTQWTPRTLSLYHGHKDEFAVNPLTGEKDLWVGAEIDDWCGYVKNIRLEKGGIIKGDLEIWDLNTAIKLMGGADVGISPRGRAKYEPGTNVVTDMIIENWALTVNPANKATYFNSAHPSDFYAFAMSEEPDLSLQGAEAEFEPEMYGQEGSGKMEPKVEEAKAGPVVEQAQGQEQEQKVEEAKEEAKVEANEQQSNEVKEASEKGSEEGKSGVDAIAALEEQIKKLQEAIEELKSKKKKKEYPYPADPMMIYPSTLEEELSDEELIKFINSLPAEELSEWMQLVKKYGVKKAAEIYRKIKESKEETRQLKEEVKKLSEQIVQLREKVDEPVSVMPKIDKPPEQVNLDDLDKGMAEYLKKIVGLT